MNEKRGLGLDIGTNSVGWALIKTDEQKIPIGIIDMGVRIFEESVKGDIEKGKEESKNADRRAKRLIRRQLKRKKRRMAKLCSLLQRLDLLPAGENADEVLRKYDISLFTKFKKILNGGGERHFSHTLLYRLRAYALDSNLEDYEFGRVLYHLAQRRGFKSNRKTLAKGDEQSIVKSGISELQKLMDENNSRTLGEYFSKVDPEVSKIRTRWTSRKMYEDEFDAIWNRQSELNPRLTEELKGEIRETIFFQRPLKSVSGFIGECTYEEGKRRCPWYSFEAQKFRIYSNLNNLRVVGNGIVRELSSDERSKLAAALNITDKLTIAQAKKLLSISKEYRFSIEDGGEKQFIGNKTNAKLINVFGQEKWARFSELEKEMILDDLVSFENEEALAKRAVRVWKLDEDKAFAFAEISLEEGYCSLSRKAINKVLPKLEEGWTLSTIVGEVYNKSNIQKDEEILKNLPMFKAKVRNPIVNRSINQTRKVVNAVIGKYGKPDFVHIELAREIKNSKKRRDAILKNNKENEKNREEARKIILKEAGIENPSREDVLRVLLWKECQGICPYTGRAISISNILGQDSQFDIEHIIPFSRSIDDSFANKTLCYHDENRNVKRNQTPFEAYANEQKYEEILQRVARFNGKTMKAKLHRFKMKDVTELEDFSQRQLNDTRYASRAAVGFMSCLYGGEIDKDGTRRVQAVTGGITYFMRSLFGMNNMLGDGEKTRDDHRHHAIDAVAIAMTNQKTITWLTENAGLRQHINRFSVKEPKEPYQGFFHDLKAKTDKIIASHFISKKVRGSLHKETIYGKSNHKGKVKQRVALSAMSIKDVDLIIDKAVKEAVKQKLLELNSIDPKKIFTDEKTLPRLNLGKSEESVIRKAKIEFSQEVKILGKDERSVVSGNNHHMEIFSYKDARGRDKWKARVVSLFEAVNRLRKDGKVVNKTWEEDDMFVCSLAKGDAIEIDKNGKRGLFIFRGTSETDDRLTYVSCNNAKKQDDLKSAKEWYRTTPNGMRELNMKKMTITPLGELRRAND